MIKKLRIALLSWLAANVLRLIYSTIRWRTPVFLEEMPEGWIEAPPPKIFLFWHSQQLMMPWFFLNQRKKSKQKIFVLISMHGDGRIIAKAVKRLGIDSVAGSSSRGAAAATRKMLLLLRQGQHVAITPDGPRGPARKVKPGIIHFASLSTTEIYPTTYSCSSYWQVNSWDKMMIPKPFCRGVFVLGRSIKIPASSYSEDSIGSYQQTFEQELERVTQAAEEALG